MGNIQIYGMEEKDLKTVIEIQKELFTADLQEDISVQSKRYKLFPEGCWVVKNKDKVVGYLITHPWRLSCPPMLGTKIEKLPESPDCLYLHDIGVLTRLASKGTGYEIVMKYKQFAKQKGYPAISLIAVMGTLDYWKRYGFIEAPLDSENEQALIEHYDAGAKYLALTL